MFFAHNIQSIFYWFFTHIGTYHYSIFTLSCILYNQICIYSYMKYVLMFFTFKFASSVFFRTYILLDGFKDLSNLAINGQCHSLLLFSSEFKSIAKHGSLLRDIYFVAIDLTKHNIKIFYKSKHLHHFLLYT